MYCQNSQQTYTSLTGLTLVIVPRPTLLGVILDGSGQPKAVKYPDHRYYTKLDYRTFPDLKGILKVDYDRIKPDMVLYQLADGTLLQADLALFVDSEMGTHNASSSDQPCYNHQVNQLKVVSMPEVEEIPVYVLSDF